MRTVASAFISRPDQRNVMVAEPAALLKRPPREHAGECRVGQQHVLRQEPHDAV